VRRQREVVEVEVERRREEMIGWSMACRAVGLVGRIHDSWSWSWSRLRQQRCGVVGRGVY